jgi:hypothetical protein
LSTLEPYADQWSYLASLYRLSPREVERLARRVAPPKVGAAVTSLVPATATGIAGLGVIASQFVDVGWSRRWRGYGGRAAALLEQIQGADCGFDAVVVGEFERAFTEHKLHEAAAVPAMHGVGVWLPETGGPVHLADPNHRVLMQVFAA